MLKMAIFLAPLFFLCISVAGQQLLQISTLHHQDSHTLGVSVDPAYLNDVASTVLMAENWLRIYVLSYYPSRNITAIIVSDNLLCDENQEEVSRLVLFAMQNVHHSLVRWGLERKIRVSIGFTPKCLHQSHLKRVFEFLRLINSTYTVKTEGFSDQSGGILSSYTHSTADLGIFPSITSRKLFSDGDYSVPSDAATSPLPPLIGVTPPMVSLPFAPETQPPMTGPGNSAPPPFGLNLPPCNPYPNPHHHRGGGAMAAPPVVGDDGAIGAPPLAFEQLWCVAKPSVPSEKLQEAMDYACGEGGADCGPISPTGSCYFPDSIVAHASYAFNSYWQRNKRNGGTCGFGGTAMLISSDPSFLQCHFTLA